ncbi:MAG TPA: hypothetical protein K8U92_08955 [Aliarcobacter thereius]|nr:hypothetical protein [Aliarcobacter thereius]HJE03993.1 hypothetical protein [Aliarcobacter thereius]
MFFEDFITTDYEILSKKHIIEKDRVVVEQKLTPKKITTINQVVKENNLSLKNDNKTPFQQYSFKYSNPFFVSLNDEQIKRLKKINNSKGLKHLVLQTYTNDNEVAIKRLEYIYNLLQPKLRINTIYKQDFCYESNPCNTTNIKLIY